RKELVTRPPHTIPRSVGLTAVPVVSGRLIVSVEEMRHVTPLLIFLGALLLAFPEQVAAINVDVTLRGSPNSMIRQNEVAKGLGYTFVETAADVEDFVERGDLIPIPGNEHYVVDDGVSYPVARPEI